MTGLWIEPEGFMVISKQKLIQLAKRSGFKKPPKDMGDLYQFDKKTKDSDGTTSDPGSFLRDLAREGIKADEDAWTIIVRGGGGVQIKKEVVTEGIMRVRPEQLLAEGLGLEHVANQLWTMTQSFEKSVMQSRMTRLQEKALRSSFKKTFEGLGEISAVTRHL